MAVSAADGVAVAAGIGDEVGVATGAEVSAGVGVGIAVSDGVTVSRGVGVSTAGVSVGDDGVVAGVAVAIAVSTGVNVISGVAVRVPTGASPVGVISPPRDGVGEGVVTTTRVGLGFCVGLGLTGT